MTGPSNADLARDLAALRAMTETELHSIRARLDHIEARQETFLTAVTQGKTGVRVLLWVLGALAGMVSVGLAVWSQVKP